MSVLILNLIGLDGPLGGSECMYIKIHPCAPQVICHLGMLGYSTLVILSYSNYHVHLITKHLLHEQS